MRQNILSVAMCDDDGEFLKRLEKTTRDIMSRRGFDCEISRYTSARALLEDIRGGREFSILLLDVVMDDMDGIEVARALRSDARLTPIIFISAYPEKAIYGYEIEALRFLEKPVDDERLREALFAAEGKLRIRTLPVRTPDGLIKVDVREITYAEMLRRGVCIHLSDGRSVATHMKIGDMEALLPGKSFFRCHQGYIINMDFITSIFRCEAKLKDGKSVPVSRYRLAAFRDGFVAFLND